MRTIRNFLLSSVAATGCAFGASGALAQTMSNEVWIGQTGNTNTIVIVQEGETNRAGADNVELRLDQDGDFNALSIDQYGWNNEAGARFLGDGRPAGIEQIGDRNEIDIGQRNSLPDGSGFNIVGAVVQTSGRLIFNTANTLLVRQSENGGSDLAAGHRINSVVQTNDLAESSANRASIWQSGGGTGLGNTVDAVFQSGHANVAEIMQASGDNNLGTVQQIGAESFLQVEQGGDLGNLIETAQQYGTANSATVRQSGTRNVIQRILQNNEILAAGGIGNRMEVVVTGADNGGDGLGDVGEFLSDRTLALSGVAQSNLVQMGDDNDLRLTILNGEQTKFGIWQVGDGNGAIVSVSGFDVASAFRNEVAIFQDGLDNNLGVTTIGNENVVAASQRGERNVGTIRQEGVTNVIVLDVDGNDNNAPSLGGFAPAVTLVAGALDPGRIEQAGLDNLALVGVSGSRNLHAVSQTGDSHLADVTVLGAQNQIAVVQTGASNQSLSLQAGDGNSLVVRQY